MLNDMQAAQKSGVGLAAVVEDMKIARQWCGSTRFAPPALPPAPTFLDLCHKLLHREIPFTRLQLDGRLVDPRPDRHRNVSAAALEDEPEPLLSRDLQPDALGAKIRQGARGNFLRG